jgi:hypothetical protein
MKVVRLLAPVVAGAAVALALAAGPASASTTSPASHTSPAAATVTASVSHAASQAAGASSKQGPQYVVSPGTDCGPSNDGALTVINDPNGGVWVEECKYVEGVGWAWVIIAYIPPTCSNGISAAAAEPAQLHSLTAASPACG